MYKLSQCFISESILKAELSRDDIINMSFTSRIFFV